MTARDIRDLYEDLVYRGQEQQRQSPLSHDLTDAQLKAHTATVLNLHAQICAFNDQLPEDMREHCNIRKPFLPRVTVEVLSSQLKLWQPTKSEWVALEKKIRNVKRGRERQLERWLAEFTGVSQNSVHADSASGSGSIEASDQPEQPQLQESASSDGPLVPVATNAVSFRGPNVQGTPNDLAKIELGIRELLLSGANFHLTCEQLPNLRHLVNLAIAQTLVIPAFFMTTEPLDAGKIAWLRVVAKLVYGDRQALNFLEWFSSSSTFLGTIHMQGIDNIQFKIYWFIERTLAVALTALALKSVDAYDGKVFDVISLMEVCSKLNPLVDLRTSIELTSELYSLPTIHQQQLQEMFWSVSPIHYTSGRCGTCEYILQLRETHQLPEKLFVALMCKHFGNFFQCHNSPFHKFPVPLQRYIGSRLVPPSLISSQLQSLYYRTRNGLAFALFYHGLRFADSTVLWAHQRSGRKHAVQITEVSHLENSARVTSLEAFGHLLRSQNISPEDVLVAYFGTFTGFVDTVGDAHAAGLFCAKTWFSSVHLNCSSMPGNNPFCYPNLKLGLPCVERLWIVFDGGSIPKGCLQETVIARLLQLFGITELVQLTLEIQPLAARIHANVLFDGSSLSQLGGIIRFRNAGIITAPCLQRISTMSTVMVLYIAFSDLSNVEHVVQDCLANSLLGLLELNLDYSNLQDPRTLDLLIARCCNQQSRLMCLSLNGNRGLGRALLDSFFVARASNFNVRKLRLLSVNDCMPVEAYEVGQPLEEKVAEQNASRNTGRRVAVKRHPVGYFKEGGVLITNPSCFRQVILDEAVEDKLIINT